MAITDKKQGFKCLNSKTDEGPVQIPITKIMVTIRGRVQGVGFRNSVAKKAKSIGLSGWVCNQADGSVYCLAQGTDSQLEQLLGYLHKGPILARVDSVDVVKDNEVDAIAEGFEVRW